MLRWFIGSSLKYRFIVMAFAGGLMFFGVLQLANTNVDVFPEFAPPRVEIQTPALGLSATEVESLVTIPLEQTMAGIPGLDELRSNSVEQLSSILLIFDRGTDLLEARQLVNERLLVVGPTLPTWAAPPVMIQPLSSTEPCDEDRSYKQRSERRHDRHVDGFVLDDPHPPAPGRGCRQRSDLG